MTEVRLSELGRCFQGLIPCALATASQSGVPNITYLSQLLYVDERHVALSRQFFNKTQRNLRENPFACVQVHDALTYEAYRLDLHYVRSETSGALFDEQAARLEAIAGHTGMRGVFRLQALDVCEVLAVTRVDGFLSAPPEGAPSLRRGFERGPMTELRGLQLVSQRINGAASLEALLADALASFDELFGFRHSMILLADEARRTLVTIESRGYGASGAGAEVRYGDGLIGAAATTRRAVRVSGLKNELRYSRAARERLHEAPGLPGAVPEIALPGVPDAESQLALPMLVAGELVGVLAFESPSGIAFEHWHEAFVQVLANQLAIGIVRFRDEIESEPPAAAAPATAAARPRPARVRAFTFYRNDDCVFVDGEYLVRNVPGKILWKVLQQHARDGRRDFSNRELRLDPTLGLPAHKDNLESRLVLLRKRLEEKCPEVRLPITARGRFALELACDVELHEREHA